MGVAEKTRLTRKQGLTGMTGWFRPLYMKCHCDISHGVGGVFPCKPSNPIGVDTAVLSFEDMTVPRLEMW
jgi:hypothetical protein